AVGIGAATLEVIKQLAAAADHAQQTAAGVVIFLVFLEVAREFIDAGGEQRNLHFGGTRVAGGALELRDDLGFVDIGNSHFQTSEDLRQGRGARSCYWKRENYTLHSLCMYGMRLAGKRMAARVWRRGALCRKMLGKRPGIKAAAPVLWRRTCASRT